MRLADVRAHLVVVLDLGGIARPLKVGVANGRAAVLRDDLTVLRDEHERRVRIDAVLAAEPRLDIALRKGQREPRMLAVVVLEARLVAIAANVDDLDGR